MNMDPGNDGHASEYSYISDNSYDTIDELLKRFTLEFTPEYSLKLRDTYVCIESFCPWYNCDGLFS